MNVLPSAETTSRTSKVSVMHWMTAAASMGDVSVAAQAQSSSFHLFDETILAIHISVQVEGVGGGEASLERRIFVSERRVSAQEVAEGEMSRDVRRAALKCVKLVRPDACRIVAAEVAPPGNAKFAHHFVADRFHLGASLIDGADV